MAVEEVDTIVVGGGQAGIAMSEHLTDCGVPHLVLERHRVAERWRSERWDSLAMNGPAWHDRFPGMEFPNTHPDSFPNKATRRWRTKLASESEDYWKNNSPLGPKTPYECPN